MMRIRLTRKLAATLNGVDVSAINVGDIIELPDRAATMMIAEGWAKPIPDELALTHVVLREKAFYSPPLTRPISPGWDDLDL